MLAQENMIDPSGHFDNNVLNQFVKGRYPLAEIIEMSKHIAQCLDCTGRLKIIAPDFIDETEEKNDGKHLSKEEVVEYLKSELPFKHIREVSEHFRNCFDCRKKLYSSLDPEYLGQTLKKLKNMRKWRFRIFNYFEARFKRFKVG
jgi:hypothetical protein